MNRKWHSVIVTYIKFAFFNFLTQRERFQIHQRFRKPTNFPPTPSRISLHQSRSNAKLRNRRFAAKKIANAKQNFSANFSATNFFRFLFLHKFPTNYQPKAKQIHRKNFLQENKSDEQRLQQKSWPRPSAAVRPKIEMAYIKYSARRSPRPPPVRIRSNLAIDRCTKRNPVSDKFQSRKSNETSQIFQGPKCRPGVGRRRPSPIPTSNTNGNLTWSKVALQTTTIYQPRLNNNYFYMIKISRP